MPFQFPDLKPGGMLALVWTLAGQLPDPSALPLVHRKVAPQLWGFPPVNLRLWLPFGRGSC